MVGSGNKVGSDNTAAAVGNTAAEGRGCSTVAAEGAGDCKADTDLTDMAAAAEEVGDSCMAVAVEEVGGSCMAAAAEVGCMVELQGVRRQVRSAPESTGSAPRLIRAVGDYSTAASSCYSMGEKRSVGRDYFAQYLAQIQSSDFHSWNLIR